MKTWKKGKEEGLLECIAGKTGCNFLSDLHQADYEKMRDAFHELDIEAYSLEEWKDAARYLTGETCDLSKEEVLNYILNHK